MPNNFDLIISRINAAARRANRDPKEICLVAVSKKQPLEKIQDYCRQLSEQNILPVIGENYVQEFRDKKLRLPNKIEAHLIGPLQSNKVKLAVELFDVIESADSLKIIGQINLQALKTGKIQQIFLQVNISHDQAKSGFMPESFNQDLFDSLKSFTNIKVTGLMTITRLYENPESARPDFKSLKLLSLDIKQAFGLENCALSMGMSDDFEIAIEEGATHVRIGTALFGERVV